MPTQNVCRWSFCINEKHFVVSMRHRVFAYQFENVVCRKVGETQFSALTRSCCAPSWCGVGCGDNSVFFGGISRSELEFVQCMHIFISKNVNWALISPMSMRNILSNFVHFCLLCIINFLLDSNAMATMSRAGIQKYAWMNFTSTKLVIKSHVFESSVDLPVFRGITVECLLCICSTNNVFLRVACDDFISVWGECCQLPLKISNRNQWTHAHTHVENKIH